MACDKPLMAVLGSLNKDGKRSVRLLKNRFPYAHEEVTPLPCGRCAGCLLDRSRQWAVRLMKEAKLHDRLSFLTLTYDDAHVPKLPDGKQTLVLEHIQLFLKRVRRFCEPRTIRFFQCGEYGSKTLRPHHHCILFGEDFSLDRKRIEDTQSGFPQYESAKLTELWGKGRATLSDVNFDTAAYVARYNLKKFYGSGSKYQYGGRKPEFITMSRRPGIGADYFHEFKNDIYSHDEVVPELGRPPVVPPRYFDRLLEKEDPELFQVVKKKRLESLDHDFVHTFISTRLEVVARVRAARMRGIKRGD